MSDTYLGNLLKEIDILLEFVSSLQKELKSTRSSIEEQLKRELDGQMNIYEVLEM